jgi:hypothetical protein
MFLVVVSHELGDFKALNYYDVTWEGGWGTMNMQGGDVVATHNKMV